MEIVIRYLERTLPDGVCFTSHWTATKKVNGFSSSVSGRSSLPAKDPSDPTFVPYEDITEAQAIEWTTNAVGEEKLAEIDAKLSAEIEAKQAPSQAAGVPWGTDPVQPEQNAG